VLRHKRLQHLDLHARRLAGAVLDPEQRSTVLDMRRKVGAIAQVPAPAHHGQVDARLPAFDPHGQDVDIPVRHRLHRLLVPHIRKRGNLVAQFGGPLELKPLGMGQHAQFQRADHGLRLAAKEAAGVRDVLRVIGLGDVPHTGAGAALDLVQQAGARAVGKHRVLARTQAKRLLQQHQRFPDGPRVGIGSEIVVA
jgi:hypothetical protein